MIDVASGEAFGIFYCDESDSRIEIDHRTSAMAGGNIYLLSWATNSSGSYSVAQRLRG